MCPTSPEDVQKLPLYRSRGHSKWEFSRRVVRERCLCDEVRLYPGLQSVGGQLRWNSKPNWSACDERAATRGDETDE